MRIAIFAIDENFQFHIEFYVFLCPILVGKRKKIMVNFLQNVLS
jgi:hypothetical protein